MTQLMVTPNLRRPAGLVRMDPPETVEDGGYDGGRVRGMRAEGHDAWRELGERQQ